MDEPNAKNDPGALQETRDQGVSGISVQQAEEEHRREIIRRAQAKKKAWEAENSGGDMSWAGTSKDPNRPWDVGS